MLGALSFTRDTVAFNNAGNGNGKVSYEEITSKRVGAKCSFVCTIIPLVPM